MTPDGALKLIRSYDTERRKVAQEVIDVAARLVRDTIHTAKQYVAMKDGELPSLVAGSNIAGFVKVVRAMHDQGDWF